MQRLEHMDTTSLHTEIFHASLFGTIVPVELRIASTYLAVMDFTLQGSTYTFSIDKWRSRSLNAFLQRFHSHGETPRDAEVFGRISVDGEGASSVHMNVSHKMNTVVQASKDVLICLDKIVKHYQRAVLDYAV
jgi:hypothetical protein